jgi:hypothetical protein
MLLTYKGFLFLGKFPDYRKLFLLYRPLFRLSSYWFFPVLFFEM